LRSTADGAQRASRRPFQRLIFGAIVVLALMGFQFAVAAPAAAAVAPKVAIIVGPAGTQTKANLAWGRAAAAEARRYTSNVVEVHTPRATWSRVKAAMDGASLVVYIGRGRGFPSSFSKSLNTVSEDGFGLNPRENHGSTAVKFYGEKYIRTVTLADHALVVLSRAAYASGGGEPGQAAPSLSVARKRISNYAAGFLAAGAGAVIADQFHYPVTYIRGVFTKNASLDRMWRNASGNFDHVTAFNSSRGHSWVGRTDTRTSSSGFSRSIMGHPTGTSTVAVRLGIPVATPPPPPVSAPSGGSSGLYGTGINADTKAQIQVGGTDTSSSNNLVAHRFRASTTSDVTSVRFAQRRGPGYSGGNGGTMRISVRPDDGHGRPSSTILTSANYTPGSSGLNTFDRVTFSSPARLTAGHIYYIVFQNTSASPRSNFISVNETFIYGSVLSPRQPRWTDANYAVLATGSGSWAVMGKYTADMDVGYSNGVHDGDGYVAAQIGYYGTISGSSDMVRERFTVSGSSRSISTVAVRMRRSGGSSPLVIRLETSSGALIDSVSIPASSVPATSPGGDNGGQVWVRASFGQSHTLAKGSTYNIRLSTASGSTYTATPIQEGTDLGFRSFVFSDGLAQRTTNGSSWAALYQWAPLDLQFYLK
jgi:hypothetical protein